MSYVDLIGSENSQHGDDYFDPKEFEARTLIEDDHYWHLHRREILLDALREVCPDSSRPLIEVGCGIGTVATHLNANGYHVDYCDVHGAGLEHAERRATEKLGPDLERKFLRFDVSQGRLPGNYSGVLMFDVLEHLEDHQLVLENLASSLSGQPDSFALVTVPAFQFLWSPWDDLEKHKRRYTNASLTRVAERAGFEVERVTCFFSPLFVAALTVKGLRTLRNGIAPPPPATEIGDLTEAKSHPLINYVALRVLRPERRWLAGHDLGFGTSLLALLRPAAR